MKLHITNFALHPHLSTVVAQWYLDEWNDYYGNHTCEQLAAELSVGMKTNAIPLRLIALEKGVPLGVVALSEKSIETHEHLSPWITGLYVVPDKRHCGVATSLVEAAIEEARMLQVQNVYIAVQHAAEHYESTGWTLVETFDYHGAPMNVLQITI